jgi:arginase
MGAHAVAAKALETVTQQTVGFWIHLDLDVVDESEMPAVDSPEPDGLSFAVLSELVGKLLASPKCVGIELTIYDPDLDPLGLGAEKIVRCLERAFLNTHHR